MTRAVIYHINYWDLENDHWRWEQRPLVTSQDEMEELFQKTRNNDYQPHTN